MDELADVTRTSKMISKEKVPDDQSIQVPPVFTKWKKTEGIAW
jgi:hypothetical protein